MDKQNEQALAAALSPNPVSYELTPRAAHVGGGWRLQLFEGAFEVGGGIYPASSSAEDDVMYEEALSDGEAWVLSRGECAPASADNPSTAGAELQQLRQRVSELEAARIAYASEFPLVFGEPDVGSIHANIRALKAKLPDSPSTAGADEPNAVSMLSGALNHARDALRFYADKAHFHMHQPDEWDTVSGEPQNFYEDSNNTATVEDGSVAKQALEDIAHVERYASLAAPVAQSTAGAAKGGISINTADFRTLLIDYASELFGADRSAQALGFKALVSHIDSRLAAPALNPSEVASVEDARDAARWREALRHVGGAYTDVGAQRFTFRYLNPVEGTNIMKGGVSGHFTDAIDAAMSATQEGK